MNKNNQNGVTLISLVVSIIIMLILTSVTVTTSFTAYENAKAEKLKAQLKAIEEAVAEFKESYSVEAEEKQQKLKERIKEKEQLETKLNLLKEKNASGTYTYSSAETDQMQRLEEKISEYTDVDNDRFFLVIDDKDEIVRNYKDGSTSTYRWRDWNLSDQLKKYGYSEEKANSAASVSNVNFYPEYFSQEMRNWNWDDWWDFFEEYYPEVTESFKYYDSLLLAGRSFEEIEESASGSGVNSVFYHGMLQCTRFYNFDSEDLEKVFGLKDIDISVNIDPYNKVVFLAKPEKIDGENIYTLRQLDDNASFGTWGESSATTAGKIRIDEIANYGTSKKIKLTLNTEEAEFDNPTFNYTDFKIRKAYYKTKKDNKWYEVDNLKECEYSEDGRSVTFIVYESGDYKFRIEDTFGENVAKMEQFTKFNIRTTSTDDPANYEEITFSVNDGYYNIILCNAPQLTSDMIPIKWIYENEDKRSGFWVVCTTIDPEWYNYSESNKMWANVMFKKDSGKGATGTFVVGEQIAESMLGSTFVWVPRFTSRIDTSKTTKLGYNVQFVKDTSNTTTFGTNAYATNLEIPLAFRNNGGKQGSWDSELKGLWFAKYDTGLELDETHYGYGGSAYTEKVMWDNSREYDGKNNYFDKVYKDGQTFNAVSKPYHVAWHNINISTAFTQSLMFYRSVSTLNEDKTANINSHLMKSTEYDILQIITREPKTGTTSLKANTSNRYTGGSDGKNGFSVMNFTAQSSNGNITGIFDVAGTTDVMLSNWILPYSNIGGVYLWLLDNNGKFLINTSLIDSGDTFSGNLIENEDDLKEFCLNNTNKYLQTTYTNTGWISMFAIGEDVSFSKEKAEVAGPLTRDYTNLSADDPALDDGFRMVIANSPSGTSENFIYTNLNFVPNEESIGFFVTDDDGNVIKTNDEYIDASGNKTYYSMTELISEGFFKIESAVLKPGTNFNILKQKTGKLNLGRNTSSVVDIDSGYTSLDTVGIHINEVQDGLFENWNSSSSGGKLIKVNMSACKSVKKIGDNVFENCSDLKEIVLPPELEEIGQRTFANCTSLDNVVFPNTLKKIGGTDATLGSKVNRLYEYTSLKGESFIGCTSLTSITIPSSIDIIGCKSFYGCSHLSSVTFDEGIGSCIISAHAFAGTAINTIIFPDRMDVQIQKGAFANCKALTDVFCYPKAIASMDYAVFANCENLENFKLTDTYWDGEESINLLEDTFNSAYSEPINERGLRGVFQNCTNLKNIDISAFGTLDHGTIPERTFYSCINLGVEEIKNLDDNITRIKTGAFLNCSNIGTSSKPFLIPVSVTQIDSGAFGKDNGEARDLYINYAGTYEEWQNISKDSNWKVNANIIIETTDGIYSE